ncbi:hypothetical protein LTR65_005037 [Meristemomyces frigidus]
MACVSDLSEGSPAKRPSFRHKTEVIVGTGASRESFTFHIEVLCARSSFFKAACARWKDGKPIKLVDDDPETFNRYLQCVYQDKLPDIGPQGSLDHFVDVYVLADQLGDLQSNNIIIDGLTRISNESGRVPAAGLVSRAWNVTPANSPLRRLLLDFIVHELASQAFEDYADLLATDVLRAVAKEFRRLERPDDENEEGRVGDKFSANCFPSTNKEQLGKRIRMATNATSPPTKKAKYLDTVVVLIGADKIAFTVYTDVLCKRSPFLQAAPAARWQKQGEEKNVDLQEHKPAVFDHYLQCVYKDSAAIDTDGAVAELNAGRRSHELEYPKAVAIFATLTESYILADKLGDVLSCNLIINEYARICDELDWIPDPCDIQLI